MIVLWWIIHKWVAENGLHCVLLAPWNPFKQIPTISPKQIGQLWESLVSVQQYTAASPLPWNHLHLTNPRSGVHWGTRLPNAPALARHNGIQLMEMSSTSEVRLLGRDLKGEARQAAQEKWIEFVYHHKKGHFHMDSKDMNIMCVWQNYKRIFGEIQ